MSREKSSTFTKTKNKTSCRVCLPTIMSRLGLCTCRNLFSPLPLPHSPRVHCHYCAGPFLWIYKVFTYCRPEIPRRVIPAGTRRSVAYTDPSTIVRSRDAFHEHSELEPSAVRYTRSVCF